ncbi:hypothetical protein BJX65DRAFT_301264 [Aspergillus insuetus]
MTPAPPPPPEYNSDSPPPYIPPTRPNTPIDSKIIDYPNDPVSIRPFQYSHDYRPYTLTLTVLRTLQYLLAVIALAVYAPEPRKASSTHNPTGWLYAGLVAWLSGVVCLLYFLIPVKHSEWWCAGDAVVAILWLVQVAGFGGLLYLDGRTGYEIRSAASSVARIRGGAWVLLASLVVWVGSVVVGILVCASGRKSRRGLGGEKGGIDAGEGFWSLGKTRRIEMRRMGYLEKSFESNNVGKQ